MVERERENEELAVLLDGGEIHPQHQNVLADGDAPLFAVCSIDHTRATASLLGDNIVAQALAHHGKGPPVRLSYAPPPGKSTWRPSQLRRWSFAAASNVGGHMAV